MKENLFQELVNRLNSEDVVEAYRNHQGLFTSYHFKLSLNRNTLSLVFTIRQVEKSEDPEIPGQVSRVVLSVSKNSHTTNIMFTEEQTAFLLKKIPEWVKMVSDRIDRISSEKGEEVLSKLFGLNTLEEPYP